MNSRLLATVTAVAVVAVAASACNGGDPPGAAPTTTGTTMPAADASVRYDREVLYVGGVPLTQFPGYEKDSLQRMPVGWPTADELIVSSKAGSGPPIVSAAVFRPDNPKSSDAAALLDMVDESFGDHFMDKGDLVVDDTITGAGRTCHLRVRSGPISARDPDLMTVAGAVVALGGSRPNVGVVVDAGPNQPIEKLTREIAEALCQPT
jgi:hypothetical protein